MDERLADLSGLSRRPGEAWRRAGWWGRKPLWERVRDVAQQDPDKPAILEYDRGVITYRELWIDSCRYSAAMRSASVGPRDVILVQLPNWAEFIKIAIGAEVARVVFSFCPVQWDKRETVRALRLIRPRIWFTTASRRPGEDRSDLLREIITELGAQAPRLVSMRSSQASDEAKDSEGLASAHATFDAIDGGYGQEPLEIAVTSGSTGDPKGVLHVHDSALATVDSTIERQGITSKDIIHIALPLGHTFGYFYGMRCALQAGATILLQHGWNVAEAVEMISRNGATISLGPSAFIIDMAGLPPEQLQKLSTLWLFTLSGDSLPAPVVRKVAELLPFRISRALGMTEFGHALSTDAHMSTDNVADTLGTPQPGMKFRITDEAGRPLPAGQVGQIGVSGPFLFAGYLTEKALNQDVLDRDGFFQTGDLGTLDNAGFLRITGRIKNVIRRGAETIPVSLLEDTIAGHPNVLHTVVVGVPDARLGEVPIACVQVKPGKSLTLADLERLFLDQHITKKYWPTGLQIVDSWPIGATGKIDRTLLTQRLSKTVPADERGR